MNNSLTSLREKLIQVKDIERLIMKISAGYATPRDLMALHHSFAPIGSFEALLASFPLLGFKKKLRN